MIPTLYEGSVKNVLGPVSVEGVSSSAKALVFEYTDAFSVFDWGRMPDTLPKKGEALAVMAAHLMERLEKKESWLEFRETETCRALAHSARERGFGPAFEEVGDRLCSLGLSTHYMGLLDEAGLGRFPAPMKPLRLSAFASPRPISHLLVKKVSVVRPSFGRVMGKEIPDYAPTRSAHSPRLVPLEVIFRFSCPPGSSLPERMPVNVGDRFNFPILEVFTKLESSDRPLAWTEALAIAGISAGELERTLLKTAWVGGFLKELCRKNGLELADGKLEWALDGNRLFLVDAIGPDELRILSGENQLSKEFLRSFYRKTPWFDAVKAAKKGAEGRGVADWKVGVPMAPPSLPAPLKELASELYQALANRLCGRDWFREAWSLEKVIEGIREATKEGGSP